jgi:hypothetical protein
MLAAVASQIPSDAANWRSVLAVGAAVCLFVIAFFGSRLLSSSHLETWTRARAASEALKREAYKFAAKATPYDDPITRETRLNDERKKIEADVDDLLGAIAATAGKRSAPDEELRPDEYIDRRLRYEIAWYGTRADQYHAAALRLRRIEFGLALLAGIVTAALGVAGKDPLFGLPFDFVALTAVLTTIGGAILAHIESAGGTGREGYPSCDPAAFIRAVLGFGHMFAAVPLTYQRLHSFDELFFVHLPAWAVMRGGRIFFVQFHCLRIDSKNR